jgi:membrane-bound serine protease (ClpP class)
MRLPPMIARSQRNPCPPAPSRLRKRTGKAWRAVLALGALIGLLLGVVILPGRAAAAEKAVVLDINGAIGPAVADYIARELGAAKPGETGLIILRMNTPGGLDSAMRRIIAAILASPVPVATYVAPRGARAASAGTYIAYASAVAAMAPGTNIGAATPIQLRGPSFLPGGGNEPSGQNGGQSKEKTGEPADTETRKIINDAAAYIRSLADLNGRNAEWGVEAVRNAASLSAAEALRLHVIDVIADDIPDLLRQSDGRTVRVAGKPQRLMTAGLASEVVAPGWSIELLAIITDPNVAFILMMIGVYGVIFEFLSPGAVAPGVVGAVSLLVALYALNLLPINYAGVALVALGVILMVMEAHIGAFGALGIGGLAAFVIGALMMFPEQGTGFGLSLPVLAALAIVSFAFFTLLIALVVGGRRRRVVSGGEALVGAEGETVSWQGSEGQVRVAGEIWLARTARPLPPGARVKVVGRDGLVLVVEPA